jgi:hypothetical protein
MNFETFKSTNPGLGEIDLFISGGNNVHGITVSKFNCENVDFTYSLNQANSITINSTEIPINSRTTYESHFFFKTPSTSLNISASNIGSGNCTVVSFTPFIAPIPFTYNDYNAILGNTLGKTLNAQGQLVNYEGLRTTNFIFDVDRTKDQIVPSNIQGILSGSGTPAKFPESNHSDTGLTNARYNGSKTSTADFGTIPALTGVIFNGSLHPSDLSNLSICSQSIEDRNVKELLYAPNIESDRSSTVNQEVPKITYRYLNIVSLVSPLSPTTTLINVDSFLDIFPGDIIKISGAAPAYSDEIEIMRVNSVSAKSSIKTIFSVTRVYKQNIDATNTSLPSLTSENIRVEKVLGDTIYDSSGNQVFKLKDRKLWIQQTLQIYYIDDTGKLLFELETCTV